VIAAAWVSRSSTYGAPTEVTNPPAGPDRPFCDVVGKTGTAVVKSSNASPSPTEVQEPGGLQPTVRVTPGGLPLQARGGGGSTKLPQGLNSSRRAETKAKGGYMAYRG